MRRGLLNRLRQLAADRCDYCRLPSAFDPLPFQVDHIIAEQHGGETHLEKATEGAPQSARSRSPAPRAISAASAALTYTLEDSAPKEHLASRTFLRYSLST